MRFLEDDLDNADGEKKKSKSSKQKKRKNDTLAESGVVDQSNNVEDGLGQENTLSSEPDKPEKRKSKGKKRKSEKKAGKTEGNDFSKRQKGMEKIDSRVFIFLFLYLLIMYVKFKTSEELNDVE